jgi:hypothetical protein
LRRSNFIGRTLFGSGDSIFKPADDVLGAATFLCINNLFAVVTWTNGVR